MERTHRVITTIHDITPVIAVSISLSTSTVVITNISIDATATKAKANITGNTLFNAIAKQYHCRVRQTAHDRHVLCYRIQNHRLSMWTP